MPMINFHAATGTTFDEHTLAHDLAAAVMRWEEVPPLATELRERGARYGVLGVCVGSGQGVALVLENPSA
jgi:hypothetical protein